MVAGIFSMLGILILLIVIGVVVSCVRIVRQAQALVIERLGAYQATSGHRNRVLWQLTLQEVNCSLVKKRVSKIQPVYWEECLMVSNTVALTILM